MGECLADPVCVENAAGTEHVCVEWSQVGDPVEDRDFSVNYGPQGNGVPSIQLITGDPGWKVYSEVISTGAPANIAKLTLDPSVSDGEFEVTIAKGGGAGAANVGSIKLTAPDWTGGSSLDGGHLTGNLTTDLTLVESEEGTGGDITGTFTIGGNVSGDVDVVLISGTLDIGGDLSGDIDVTDRMKGGNIVVDGDVAQVADIVIADMVDGGGFPSTLTSTATSTAT